MILQAERRVTFPEDLWVALQEWTGEQKKKLSPEVANSIDEKTVAVDIVREKLVQAGVYPSKGISRECPR